MPKGSGVPYKYGRKLCLFCGGGPASKEHIWATWSHPILPQGGNHETVLLKGSRSTRIAHLHHNRRRNGAFYTLKIKRACITCNTGWMRTSEERVRPYLERMIVGDPVTLSPTETAFLAEYLTYKLLLMDWLHEQPLLTLEHGKAFHECRKMPPNFVMFIANCYEGRWRSQFRAMELPFYHEEDYTPELPPNAKSFAIGLGNLFVFALTSEVQIEINANPALAASIWPITGSPLQWPPKFPIGSDDAEFIANTLLRMGKTKTSLMLRRENERRPVSTTSVIAGPVRQVYNVQSPCHRDCSLPWSAFMAR